jgi:outer membrane protein assembly factor BamD (BamD/ComL family)
VKTALKKNTIVSTFVLSVVFIYGPCFLWGQQSVLKGTVYDKEGNTLENVKIILLDSSRGTKFSMRSGKDGKFMKVGIPPSVYKVSVEHEGYVPFKSKIRVRMGMNQGFKISLEKIPVKIDGNEDFIQGINLFKGGDYKNAIEYFIKVSRQFPDNFEVFYNLGLSYLKNGQVDEAIVALEKTKQLRSDLVEVHFALGECYFKKENKEKAIEAFSQAIECQPDNARAYFNLGIIHYSYDEAELAIECFKKSIELDPEYSLAHYHAGLASAKIGDIKSAISFFEEFLRLKPDAPEAEQVKIILQELKKKTSS